MASNGYVMYSSKEMWRSANFSKELTTFVDTTPTIEDIDYGSNTLREVDNSNSDPGVIPQTEGSAPKEQNTNIPGPSTRSFPRNRRPPTWVQDFQL